MNQLLQTLRNLGPLRMVALGGVFLILLVFFGFMATKMHSGAMALLYSNLDPGDGGQIISQLDSMKVPYEVSDNGANIKVPAEQVGKLRMSMAQQGLPHGGSVGYEIFDQKDGFSTTSFVQNINQMRALEGELARTISTLTPIQATRVHLVLPKREMFSQTEQKASASVFLKMRPGASLDKGQVAAIRQLIAAAVPNLQSDNVSVVDDHGTLLAKAAETGGAAAEAGDRDEMRMDFEKNQVAKIEELLSRSLGYGKVRAQVSAEMDFDRITTNSEIFDPESQVVRSTQTVNEDGKSTENGQVAVSASTNLPSTTPATPASTTNNSNARAEETINYEINKTVSNHVRESGTLKKQSVAVLVDGTYETGKDGKAVYKPRSKEELEQIKALVKSAVAIDTTRGDTLEVVNMQFMAEGDGAAPNNEELYGFAKSDVLRVVESVLMAVVGLLAVLLVIGPILKQVFGGNTASIGEGQASLADARADGVALADGGTATTLPAPKGSLTNQPGAAQLSGGGAPEETMLEHMLDISRVEGQVKASSVRKVGEIVEKHPEEAVSIIRNWMNQEN